MSQATDHDERCAKLVYARVYPLYLAKVEKHPRALSLMKAQAAVAEYAEFRGNVAFVGIKNFWRDEERSPLGQAHHWNTNAEPYYLIGEAMGNALLKLHETRSPTVR